MGFNSVFKGLISPVTGLSERNGTNFLILTH
jgi:hypothetical protein